MTTNSAIEWTHHTFNPWWGCTKVSPACDHCYAEAIDKRTGGKHWGPKAYRRYVKQPWSEVWKWQAEAEQAGERRRVFCASMADIFEKSMSCVDSNGNQLDTSTGRLRQRVFQIIEQTPNLDWLLLTKRIENAPSMVPPSWTNAWPSNAWALATVGNQEEADRVVPKLLQIPAVVRGLSCEPLLGPVDLERAGGLQEAAETCHYGELHRRGECECSPGVDWVIAGGESGPGARPMRPDWVRSLRDQCVAAGVPFFFKQWGEFTPAQRDGNRLRVRVADDAPPRKKPRSHRFEDGQEMLAVGKKQAGRTLDGETWDQMPEATYV